MIYAITDTKNNAVKIGYSKDEQLLEQRIRSLQTSCPYPLTLLGKIEGDFRDENEMHKRLYEHRTGGGQEWFHLNRQVKSILIDEMLIPWEDGFDKPLKRDPDEDDLSQDLPSSTLGTISEFCFDAAKPITPRQLYDNHIQDAKLVWSITHPWAEMEPHLFIDDMTIFNLIHSEQGYLTDDLPEILMREYYWKIHEAGYNLCAGLIKDREIHFTDMW